MEFKNILQKEKKSLGLNKTQMAALLEISTVTLDSYLSGETSPSFDRAFEMISLMQKELLVIDRYDNE